MGLEKMKLITVGKPSLKNAGFLFCFFNGVSLCHKRKKEKWQKCLLGRAKAQLFATVLPILYCLTSRLPAYFCCLLTGFELAVYAHIC